MIIKEKRDVYRFGVVALEILMGRHPSELLTSLSSSSPQNMMLNEILDQRLPSPTHLVAQDVIFIATKDVQNIYLTRQPARPACPLQVIKLGNLGWAS